MRKITLLFVVGCIALFTANCEKDDICDESASTTPRLIMQFYDIASPTVKKNVPNLKVIGEGSTVELDMTGDTDPSNIELPLKTTDDVTTYSFFINSNDAAFVNEDKIQFNYSRENLYVSRACGYKTVFILNPDTPFIRTDGAAADGFWMYNITVSQPNIKNENEIHIKVYF